MVVLAFCVPLALVVRLVAHDRAVHAAELESRSLAAVLAGTRDPAVLAPIVAEANTGSPRPATVFLPNGSVIGDVTAPSRELFARAQQGQAFTSGVAGGEAVFVPVQSGDGVSVVRVFVPEDLIDRGVYTAWAVLGALGIGLIGLAVGLADRLGRSLVRPMQQLRDTAQRLREGDRAARASTHGPVEVREVAAALNGLAGRIDELVAAEREAAADVSHRLRTPVAALRLDAERLPPGAERDRLLEEVRSLQVAVDEVIRAARTMTPKPPVEPVDLVAATRARLAFWSVLADNQQRRMIVVIDDDGPCPVQLTAVELDAAIDALVGNVFAHTPEGTSLKIVVTPERADDPATLVVEDDGPGLLDDYRVVRGASGAGSTGLGLDIARKTAEATGGRLIIGRAVGGGARVELVLGAQGRSDRRDASLVTRR
jgi:signal transduction histidine kinase